MSVAGRVVGRSRRVLCAMAALLPLVVACTGGADGHQPSSSQTLVGPTFQNPIVETGQDPYVIQYNDYYYLIQSQFGGIWITKSPKANLTDIAAAGLTVKVWSYPSKGPNCADIWAPELHQMGDRWVIYYAATTCDANNDNHRMFALESDSSDPMGSYTDRGQVSDSANRWAIDGTSFSFKGQSYFVWSGWPGSTNGQQNLYIAKMLDPFTLEGEGVLLSQPTYDWERQAMPINEGPEALVKDDTVFLIYSASGSWTDDYCLGMLISRGDDLLDPAAWTKQPQPVFSGTDEVFGPGHASFVLSPDGTQDWIVYHSARYSGAGWDRIINAQPFQWVDGLPVFGTPMPSGTRQPVPSGQQPAS